MVIVVVKSIEKAFEKFQIFLELGLDEFSRRRRRGFCRPIFIWHASPYFITATLRIALRPPPIICPRYSYD